MTLEELQYIVAENCQQHEGGADEYNLPEQLTLVDEGEWEGGGKYQYCSDVYKDDQEPPNHFMIHNSRSGSYYSDYYYSEPTVQMVKPVVETITRVVWKAV